MRVQKRLSLAAVAASVSLAAALSGCSSSATGNAVGAGGTTSSPSSSTADVPSADQLQSALLSASDLGPDYTAQPNDTSAPTDTTAPTGCSTLTNLLNALPTASPSAAQGPDAQIILQGGQTGPFVGEFLSARPQSVLDVNYPTVVDALNSCQELDFPTGTSQVPLQLSAYDMGTPGTTAKHMTGTVQGVPIHGYLAINRLSPTVAMVYIYLEVAGDSPQTAKAFFTQAIDKANTTLKGSASAASA
jgi:hypothetical protein